MEKSKLILIIGAVFIAIALVLSTVSVIMMSNVLKKVDNKTAVSGEEQERKTVPLSQTMSFQLEEPVLGVLHSKEGSGKTLSVSIEIGFLLDKSNKKTEGILEVMADKEGIIRDRISKILEKKYLEEFQSQGSTEALQNEILEAISYELETDTILEVYFISNLSSLR